MKDIKKFSENEALNNKMKFYYELIDEINESDIIIGSKISELSKIKNTVSFELNYGENYQTYKTILRQFSKKKNGKKDNETTNNDIEFDYDISIKKALEEISRPVFNNEYVEQRLLWIALLEHIEIKIYNLILSNSNIKEKKSDIKNNQKVTIKYKRDTLTLFLQLLQKQNIITDNNTKIGILFSPITGYSPTQLTKQLSTKYTYENVDPNEVDKIENDLYDILDQIKKLKQAK